MRYLKRLILAVLIYVAVYLPFVVLMQALTGYDYTAAYSVGGIVGCVELAASAVIKLIETKNEKASLKDAESEITRGESTELHTGDNHCNSGNCVDCGRGEQVHQGDTGEAESAD